MSGSRIFEERMVPSVKEPDSLFRNLAARHTPLTSPVKAD